MDNSNLLKDCATLKYHILVSSFAVFLCVSFELAVSWTLCSFTLRKLITESKLKV